MFNELCASPKEFLERLVVRVVSLRVVSEAGALGGIEAALPFPGSTVVDGFAYTIDGDFSAKDTGSESNRPITSLHTYHFYMPASCRRSCLIFHPFFVSCVALALSSPHPPAPAAAH